MASSPLLGGAVGAVKPEHIPKEMATKMAVYNRTRDIMIEAVGRQGGAGQDIHGKWRAAPNTGVDRATGSDSQRGSP